MKKIILLLVFFAGLQIGCQSQKNETIVVIHTTYGDITAKLYDDTPLHRDNFIKLIKEGWYEGSPFHRVIPNFMIQGGGNANGTPDPGYQVDAEILPNHFHKKGALAAARMPDQYNPEKKSSGSQFYIVQGQVFDDNYMDMVSAKTGHVFTPEERQQYKTLGGYPSLDGDYTVFGEVLTGYDVIDKIAAVRTAKGNAPVTPVTMTIEILE